MLAVHVGSYGLGGWFAITTCSMGVVAAAVSNVVDAEMVARTDRTGTTTASARVIGVFITNPLLNASSLEAWRGLACSVTCWMALFEGVAR